MKVDCAACHPRRDADAGGFVKLVLGCAAKMLDLKSRVSCRGYGARGRAVVSAKRGVRAIEPTPYMVGVLTLLRGRCQLVSLKRASSRSSPRSERDQSSLETSLAGVAPAKERGKERRRIGGNISVSLHASAPRRRTGRYLSPAGLPLRSERSRRSKTLETWNQTV